MNPNSYMGSKASPRRQLHFEEANKNIETYNIVNEGSQDELVDSLGLNSHKDLNKIHSSIPKGMIPEIDMEFETEDMAYQFCLAYAKEVGFGIRNMTRFGCLAKMKVNSRKTGKFRVIQFVPEHNHYLASPNKIHLHGSNRNVTSTSATDIEMANSVGIPPKEAHALIAKQVGGRENVGFIPEDYRNYLRSKKIRDEDDLITNIFWLDAKMRADYANFGDVVCFDTTYRKNNEGHPIALFVGVNHHKQTVIFGVALLYDKISLTFEWLFDTFTGAMSGQKPKTILTDQDVAMAKAFASKWPETQHRLCIWHIYQNAANHLNKEWLKRKFGIKKKWALVYGRQMFCADMATTQRSESMNRVLKKSSDTNTNPLNQNVVSIDERSGNNINGIKAFEKKESTKKSSRQTIMTAWRPSSSSQAEV
ncbi:hypothetical protein ACH5RR_015953 [Cinchona calisaya]|uniref:Protein FAR1-RELATED SEQUENCE n=1 Tax=Cinchona calisaya TaxID=153742 RepID=A0ABD2ZUL4_9GENT